MLEVFLDDEDKKTMRWEEVEGYWKKKTTYWGEKVSFDNKQREGEEVKQEQKLEEIFQYILKKIMMEEVMMFGWQTGSWERVRMSDG